MCYQDKHEPQEWHRNDGTVFTLCSWCNKLLDTTPTKREVSLIQKQKRKEQFEQDPWDKIGNRLDSEIATPYPESTSEVSLEASLAG